MASQEQIQSMLEIMQQQMQQLAVLKDENNQLRLSSNRPSAKVKQPDRPIISGNIDEREWALFMDTWRRYKLMTGIQEPEYVNAELRAACSPDVNRLLFEYVGPTALDQANEQQLLAHIRAIAVKGTHKEVHRMQFTKMMQMDNEPVTQFVARLKSQAALCPFTVACGTHSHSISYVDDMVSQQLIAGLLNHDYQSKILSESASLPTLAAKVDRLRCLEASEESVAHFRPPGATLPSQSSAAHQSWSQKPIKRATRTATPLCRGCGRTSHPGKSMRRRDCPAHGKICGACGIVGHFSLVCENTAKAKPKSSRALAAEEIPTHQLGERHDVAAFAFADVEPESDFRGGQTSARPR
jgi:hypothetical protein